MKPFGRKYCNNPQSIGSDALWSRRRDHNSALLQFSMMKLNAIPFTIFLLCTCIHLIVSQEATKSPLGDIKKTPPSIYQWIEENAHICAIVPANGESLINFLSADEGAKCSLCPEVKFGEVPKMACAVELLPNEIELDIGCHPVPDLCALELKNRFAEFFAAGGKVPKIAIPVASSQQQGGEENIFQTMGNPFSTEFNNNIDEVQTTTEVSTTVRADQFTPEAGSAVRVNISRTELSRSLGRSLVHPSTSNHLPSRPGESPNNKEFNRNDEKNFNDRDLKASNCRDNHELCCFWASAGECEINPFWMRINCAKTCGTCNCKGSVFKFLVHSALQCASTGIHCEIPMTTSTTTTSTTKITSTPVITTTSTVASTLLRGRNRVFPPGFKSRSRPAPPTPRRRPNLNNNDGDRPPGHRPQRPFMIKERVSSSSSTTTNTPSTKPEFSTQHISTTSRETCFNYHSLCLFWADLGECERNPFWMRPHCQKACQSCGETIEDVLAPKEKPDCVNQHSLCPFWSFIGECARNARWMMKNCNASCQIC